MLLQVTNLQLAYGPKVLFHDSAFQLDPRARVGLVGPNGSGKTTLLRILTGTGEADDVTIEKRTGVRIGYLPQDGLVLPDRPLLDEMEHAAGDIQEARQLLAAAETDLAATPVNSPDYHECMERLTHYSQRLQDLEAHKLQSRAESILFGLGFTADDLQSPCGAFSGGWQMRIALGRLLLQEPDLLLLDEPTNHLDLPSLRWLESFLQRYEGAVLLVSHDRAFLDQLTTSILSLERGQIVAYTGNFSAFLEQQAERRRQLEQARQNQDKAIARTERFIERFRYKATKAKQVQSRIKQLQKVERIETEQTGPSVHFEFPLSRKGGHSVIQLDEVHKAYGPTKVFTGFSLEIHQGDRIGVVGRNGAGKSTLARLLAQREKPDDGSITPGYQIDIGYFAQDQRDEFQQGSSVYQAAAAGIRATETHIRSILGAFLFGEHDIAKPVEVLSGGEKNRLALARLLLQPANFLVLDEPTNHLDMASKEVLQEALLNFPGTVFVVSHDRQFLNPVVTKVLEIEPGHHRWFPGDLDHYLWKIQQEEEQARRTAKTTQQPPQSNNTGDATAATENPRERRRRKAARQQQLAPLRHKLRQAEDAITTLEEQIATRETEMADKTFFEQGNATTEALRQYDAWKSQLATTYADWEALAHQIEQAENQDQL